MLNTTYAFNRSVIFLPGSLPVFSNGYDVPFLSFYMLVLLIDLHKQLLFAARKVERPTDGTNLTCLLLFGCTAHVRDESQREQLSTLLRC